MFSIFLGHFKYFSDFLVFFLWLEKKGGNRVPRFTLFSNYAYMITNSHDDQPHLLDGNISLGQGLKEDKDKDKDKAITSLTAISALAEVSKKTKTKTKQSPP